MRAENTGISSFQQPFSSSLWVENMAIHCMVGIRIFLLGVHFNNSLCTTIKSVFSCMVPYMGNYCTNLMIQKALKLSKYH